MAMGVASGLDLILGVFLGVGTCLVTAPSWLPVLSSLSSEETVGLVLLKANSLFHYRVKRRLAFLVRVLWVSDFNQAELSFPVVSTRGGCKTSVVTRES